MIGVLCPSEFEYEALKSLRRARVRAAVFLTGMGKVRAVDGFHRFWWRHPDLRVILLVGFAGSLTSRLRVGDVIEPTVFIEQDFDARPFEKFPHQLLLRSRPLVPGSKPAALLTQDRFLKENPYAKGPYAKRFPRLACDMEAYAVAHACRRAGIRFHAVKLISDTADETADHDFLAACKRLSPKLRRVVGQAVQVLESQRGVPRPKGPA